MVRYSVMRLFIIGILLLGAGCAIQPSNSSMYPDQGPAAAGDVRAVVMKLFDAMRNGDGPGVQGVFLGNARLQSVVVEDGEPVLKTAAVGDFVAAVGQPHDQAWDERVSQIEVHIDGALATAWMDYRFYLGDQFSHCGVDAFQLIHTRDGWKVFQLVDTHRKDCAAGKNAGNGND